MSGGGLPVSSLGGREFNARFARIGIECQAKGFGDELAHVDCISRDYIRLILAKRFDGVNDRRRAWSILAGEVAGDILGNTGFEGIESHDTGLLDQSIKTAGDLDAAAPPGRELKNGGQLSNGDEPEASRQIHPFLLVGLDPFGQSLRWNAID